MGSLAHYSFYFRNAKNSCRLLGIQQALTLLKEWRHRNRKTSLTWSVRSRISSILLKRLSTIFSKKRRLAVAALIHKVWKELFRNIRATVCHKNKLNKYSKLFPRVQTNFPTKTLKRYSPGENLRAQNGRLAVSDQSKSGCTRTNCLLRLPSSSCFPRLTNNCQRDLIVSIFTLHLLSLI